MTMTMTASYLDTQVRLYEDKTSKYDAEIDKYIQKAAVKRLEAVFKRLSLNTVTYYDA